jgi:hypothetical protein
MRPRQNSREKGRVFRLRINREQAVETRELLMQGVFVTDPTQVHDGAEAA